MYYYWSKIGWLDLKLLALGKSAPETGNRQFTQNNEPEHIDFTAAVGNTTHPRKKTSCE